MSTDGTLPPGPIPSFDFAEFSELPFPESGDIVYVLCFRREGSNDCIPFYVGESSRHVGRFGDYVAAKFTASTDFKVGQAVKRLRAHGCQVVIRFKATIDRRAEEKSLIQLFSERGMQLLNDLPGYNYATADETGEQRRVEEFTTKVLFEGKVT